MRPSPGLAALAVAILTTTAAASHAASFSESIDAPSLLPGLPVTGAGALEEIAGSLGPGDDVDLFRIRIDDPAAFSAVVQSPAVGDFELYLFDPNGIGRVATVDVDVATNLFPHLGNVNVLSFPPGGPVYPGLPPGEYLVALALNRFSNFGNSFSAFSTFGRIFVNTRVLPNFQANIVIADGPGAAFPLAAWDGNVAVNLGRNHAYTIGLTGAAFVPEPATALGAGAAALALLGLARRRVRARPA